MLIRPLNLARMADSHFPSRVSNGKIFDLLGYGQDRSDNDKLRDIGSCGITEGPPQSASTSTESMNSSTKVKVRSRVNTVDIDFLQERGPLDSC
jgi:hypothetical protein